MTAVGDAWASDGVELAAQEFRQGVVGGVFAHDADQVSARAGILNGGAADVSGLDVTVHPLTAIVTPVAGAAGSFLVPVPTDTTVTLAARDATYTRWDLIVLHVYDSSIDGSGQTKTAIEVVTGTPAPSPTEPTAPPGTLPLKRAVVPVTGNVALVDRFQWAAPQGAVLPTTSATRPAAPRLGQPIYEDDTLLLWNGSAFAPIIPPDTAFPHEAIKRSADSQIANVTLDNLISGWVAIDDPNDGIHYAGGALVADRAGLWVIECVASWGPKVSSGYRQVRITRGGSEIMALGQLDAQVTRTTIPLTVVRRLGVGDAINMGVYHNSGSPEKLEAGYTTLSMTWLSV